MKIFGDDGFRSRFGQDYMTLDFLSSFSIGIVDLIKQLNLKKQIIIGRDTRKTGEIIHKLISSILNYGGIDTFDIGVVSTPGLSYFVSKGSYSMGIMITASHNPNTDNGIKMFASDGYKLSSETEGKLSSLINSILSNHSFPLYEGIGNNFLVKSKNLSYGESIKMNFNVGIIDDIKIVVDCSNGSFSGIAENFLSNYQNISFINNKPNGENINLNCGALEHERLLGFIKDNDIDYGIAFDGDGDRVIFVHREYGLIEAEKLMVLFISVLKNHLKNYDNSIVSTTICNKALEYNLKEQGYKLITTNVGDRNVVNSVKKYNAILGAEPSGHFHFPMFSKTMDGLIALYLFIDLLGNNSISIIKELNRLSHYKRKTKNIIINKSISINLKLLQKKVEKMIDPKEEKIVLRKSMWEPVIRIYYDYYQNNNFGKLVNVINDSIDAN